MSASPFNFSVKFILAPPPPDTSITIGKVKSRAGTRRRKFMQIRELYSHYRENYPDRTALIAAVSQGINGLLGLGKLLLGLLLSRRSSKF